jgi:hypothetical protein
MVGLASTAQAFAAPTFSTVDVTAPGHAQVTVTTDAPYVAAWLRSTTLSVRVTDPVFVPTASGEAAFDLETWGVDSAQVMARGCETADVTACDPIVLSPAFVPTTVDPDITWPADDTVGAGDAYTPTVADPNGGGSLVAVYQGQRTLLDPGNPVILPLTAEGASSISVLRCSSLAPNVCRPTGLTHPVEVNRVLAAYGHSTPSNFNADVAPLTLAFEVQEGLTQSFTFDWQVTTWAGVDVPEVGGVVDNLTPDGNGRMATPVDVSALPDGQYRILGRLSYSDSSFGEVGRGLTMGSFTIDRVAPKLGSAAFSSPSLYPYKDGFLDNVSLEIRGADGNTTVRVRVTDQDAVLVRSMSKAVQGQRADFTWDGTDGSGQTLPAGTYTMNAYSLDAAGNTSAPATWTVTVVRQRLSWTRFVHTYTASETLTQVHVGTCSSVVKPSSYRWKGSIELQSESKCNRSGAPAVAESIHSAPLPAGIGTIVAGGVKMSVYGGSPIDRLSDATMWVRNGSGSWRPPFTLDQHVDWHPFSLNHVAVLLGPAHRLTWRVRVDHNSDKYSLGSVKLDVNVASLVAE